jgi:hypothetical protein
MKGCTPTRVLVAVAGAVALTLGAGGEAVARVPATATAPRSTAAASFAAARPDGPLKLLMDRSRSGWISSVLSRGRHDVTKFDPPFAFSLGKTTPAAAFLPWVTTLTLAGTEDHPKLMVAFWSRSFDLLDPGAEPRWHAGAKAAPDVPRTPAGVLEWLTANPRLSISGRKGVTVGGVRGTEIDVGARKAGAFANEACPVAANCVPFLITPPLRLSRNHGDWFEESADVGERVRIEILAVHGKLILIVIDSLEGNRAQNTRIADQFLSTVRFD